MQKICSSCNISLELNTNNFYKDKSKKDGYRSSCKQCKKEHDKEYYKTNRDSKIEYQLQYEKDNREKISIYKKQYTKKYRKNNLEKEKQRHKDYYIKNKEKINKRISLYKQKNKDHLQEAATKYIREKRKNNPLFRLISNRRTRRSKCLKKINCSSLGLKNELGCSIEEWKQYLEEKFTHGMTWENYGFVWELDEIIPISAWDLSNPIHWKACWHYLNSQPLLKKDNLTKPHGLNKDYSLERDEFLRKLCAV